MINRIILLASLTMLLVVPVYGQEGPPEPVNTSPFKGNLFEILQQQPLAYDKAASVIQLISSDQNSATLIQLREGVKNHYHANHDEIVYVLQGKGVMVVGTEKKVLHAGDLILVSRGTPHSVENKTAQPLIALSIMTPPFDGEDRIFIE